MLAPGTPTTVAEDIAEAHRRSAAMAKASSATPCARRTVSGVGNRYKPAAAMDVLDLDPQKIATMRDAVKTLDGALTGAVTQE